MSIRFSDTDNALSDAGNFIIRQRLPSLIQLLILFLTTFVTSVLISFSVTDHLRLATILMILLGLLGLYIIMLILRERDLVMMAEFQNAMFASALGSQSRFSLIVRHDGNIVYIDHHFQDMFPGFTNLPQRTLSSWLNFSGVNPVESEQVTSTVLHNDNNSHTVSMSLPKDKAYKIVLHIEAIHRPDGFVLIRGRDFVEKRIGDTTGKSTESSMPAASTPAPITYAIPSGDWGAFITHSPIAIACLNDKGDIVGANPAFHQLTQNTLAKTLPIAFADLLSSEKKAEGENILNKALGGKLPADVQIFELKLPNGVDMIVSSYFSGTEQNGEKRLVLHLIDITEQKNLELRFSHSQKMQAVGQLAGGVAHDFNNLLTAMIGFCDLLLMRHPAGDQSFADIMQIKQNANRAANLVRQLLAFSRRQTLQPKVLDLTDVLAELSNLIRRLIGENIELKMVHGRDIGHVRADQGQLEQVLINLAVNARDAMPSGGTLTIRTSRTNISRANPLPRDLVAPVEDDTKIPNGEYVLVEVVDSGCGISREILHKIFEPFFSTKPVGSGTGLGLSTVYGIIKQTGGYVYVASKEGQGTNFSIFFPSVSPQEIPSSTADSDASDKSTPVDLTGKSTILLVEDETPVRIFAARALRNKGYTILEADCAETAIALMEKHGNEVEVIITDVIMPGMTGPTMIDKLIPQFPDVKVIFISGYAEDVFVNNYGAERSFNFLAKPFTLKQLASKIKEVTG